MTLKINFELMADYNQWMNAKVYEVVSDLSAHERDADRGAFFGSVHSTLNHIMVADLIWLKRFEPGFPHYYSLAKTRTIAKPETLEGSLFGHWEELKIERESLDRLIVEFSRELNDEDLEKVLHYHTDDGIAHANPFGMLIQHFFNHQTHHRGQVTTLLSQSGIDVGETDLVVKIRERTA